MTTSQPTRLIATLSPVYTQDAMAELKGKTTVKEVFWVDTHTVLLESALPFSACTSRIWGANPYFIRHLCPVTQEIEYAYDLEEIIAVIREILSGNAAHPIFQFRTVGAHIVPYTYKDIFEAISDVCIRESDTVHAQTPVLSVVLHEAHAYIGLSTIRENGNPWAGGMRHYKIGDDTISRAEFKLQEAMALFALQLPAKGTAIDLGAAPGGWTAVLRRLGMKVVAIDPADLDERVANDSGVTHMKMTADVALLDIHDADCVVNDMRMEPFFSTKIMNAAAASLRSGAWAVMTLKLPHENPVPVIHAALKTLSKEYDCIAVRQLFHNRHEVMAILRKAQKKT